jgi:hypothetical protein
MDTRELSWVMIITHCIHLSELTELYIPNFIICKLHLNKAADLKTKKPGMLGYADYLSIQEA